jgi:MYXO-CTERM domain-containing protein
MRPFNGKDRLMIRKSTPLLVVTAAAVLVSGRAEAHFILDAPICWMSQDVRGGPQKNGPCAATGNTALGDPAGTPTKMVNAVPGQMITVSVTATVPHPGWYRIALVEGASSTQTLTSFPDPVAMAGTNCTPAIMTNPVWSTTQPVLADGLPAGSTAKTQQMGSQTFQVKVPAGAKCTAASPCALQVIMVMTDHPANDCYYHHCADVTFDGTSGGGGVSGAGGMSSVGGANGGGGTSSTGGASGTGGATGTGGAATTTGTGGETATGGTTSTGGSTSTGGVTSSGGASATGGTTSTGGSNASGGSNGSGGRDGSGGANGSGGASSGQTSQSSSGCAFAEGPGSGPVAAIGVGLILGLTAVRRRRHRR